LSSASPYPAQDVVGNYYCRRDAWERATKLRTVRHIFTKEGAKDLKIYFDEYERELELDTFLDIAARTRHHGISYATRRQQAERLFDHCMRILDERARLWLAEGRSWESLAFLPIEWSLVIKLRRQGINSVASFEMAGDSDLLKLKIGFGPRSLQLSRAYCRKALELQKQAAPKIPRAARSRRALDPATQLPF